MKENSKIAEPPKTCPNIPKNQEITTAENYKTQPNLAQA